MLSKQYGRNYHNVKVLILGAAGFIGRWVARHLAAAGADLHLVVRDPVVAQKIFDRYDIQGHTIRLDLSQLEQVRESIKAVQPAVIFNLAGYGVDRAERDEATAYLINARLVQTVCQAVAGVRQTDWPGRDIVHVGSALEYGEISGDLNEDSTPNPTTLYGQSKLAGTQALATCCQTHGVNGLTARLFTIYGPGEHPGRLLPSLLAAARSGQPLDLTAGRQQRDFTYVEDVAAGLLRLGLTTGQPGEIVNLATGRLASVRVFAETAAGVLDIPAGNLRFGAIPTRREEMQHDPVAIRRLQQLAGWQPSIEIAEGVRRTRLF